MDEKASQLARSVGANFSVATNKGIPEHTTRFEYSGLDNNNYIQSANNGTEALTLRAASYNEPTQSADRRLLRPSADE